MVAIFTGLGAGLERGSVGQLGGQGLLGGGVQGRGGDRVSVNAATGNVLITRRDEFLVGKGPDVGISRTYNSFGALDENQDHWRQSTDRRVFSHSGSYNVANSTVKRVSADGSEITYTYKNISGVNAYWAEDGAGAHDKLTYSGGVWTWTDGSSQITEKYSAYGSNNWRIIEQKDTDGNKVSFTYSGANLTKITTQDGGYVQYQWSGNKITMVQTVADGATRTRTRYGYDSSGRLNKVTVDLTPENNSISDGKTYVTTYTYDGSSKRIASITQTDGSQITFTYDGSGRVLDITQIPGNGEANRVTKVRYASNNSYTDIYDPNGVRSILYHDGSERLTRARIYSPATGIDQSTYFTYDSSDNVKSVKDAEGNTTYYSYDARGNVTKITDPTGRITNNIYDAKNNLTRVQSERSSASSNNVWSYDRFVYDSENHLRYKIDGEGRVTEYTYFSTGEISYKKEYTENAYAVGSSIPTLSQMDAWRNGISDRSSTKIFRYLYDARGQVNRTLDYGYATTSGGASTAEGYADIRYTRNASGELLSRQTIGVSSESFAFDGLGRMISSTDANGGTTSISFNDSATKTTVTNAAGYTLISTYNKAGDLVSSVDSGSFVNGGTESYKYDKNGRLRTVIDATGYKTYYIYDNAGRKTAEVNHYGHLTEYRYDKNGRVIATARYTNGISSANKTTLDTNQNNTLTIENIRPGHHSYNIWQWSSYNDRGEVVRTIEGDGAVTTYAYNKAGQLVTTKTFYNKLTSSQLSALRAGTATAATYTPSTNAKDVVIRSFYNRAGQSIGTLNGQGFLTQIKYDKSGQKVEEIAFANATSTTYRASGTYNQLYNSFSKSTSKDVRVRNVFDGQGHLRYTIDAQNYVTEFVYGTGSTARGVVRQTIQHYTKLPTLSSYKFSTVKAAVGSLANASLNRRTWAVYNTKGQQTYAINAQGEVTRMSYDTSGRVTKTTEFAVRRTTTSLPSDGTMNSWANNNGADARITRSYYSARGELRFSVDGEGYAKRFDYDREGRLTREIRWTAKLSPTDSWTTSTINSVNKGSWVDTKYSYDAVGRLSSVYDSNGTRTYTGYYANGTVSWKIDAYGSGRDESRVLYVNDAVGRTYRELEYSVGTSGARTDNYYYYDGLGNLNRVRKTRSSHAYATADQNTYFTHDKNGQVLTQTNAEGGVMSYQYDAFGRVVKTTDLNGNHSYNYYDQMGRVLTHIDGENYATKTSYTAFGDTYQVRRYYNRASNVGNVNTVPSTSSHSLDAITTFQYDNRGRVTRVTDPLGKYENYTLDAFGQRIEVRNKLGGITVNTFDKRGLLVSERRNMYAYKADFNIYPATTVTNSYSYDSRGNMTQMVEADGLPEERVTNYVYDSADRLVQKRTEAVGVYSHAADGTVSTVTPIEYYTYDRRGNLIEKKDPLGARTLYFYDRMDRITHQISPTGTLTRNFYDANSNLMETRVYASQVSLPSNALGTPPSGSGTYRRTTFTYDRLNRMTNSYVHDVQTASFGTSLSITSTTSDLRTQYQYDAMGNVVRQIDPNGKSVYSYYDKLGRKTSHVDQDRFRTDWTFNAQGNVTRERNYWNRASTPSTGNPPSVSANGTLDRISDYTYDKNGNRLSEKRLNVLRHNGSGGHVNAHVTVYYQYNALGQVTRKTEATGDQFNYYYDSQGRLLFEWRPSFTDFAGTSKSPSTRYYYNGLNQMIRTTQGISFSGNVSGEHQGYYYGGIYQSTDSTVRYTKYNYDGAGRLASTTDANGFTTTYRYDVGGRVLREEYSRTTATQGTKQEAMSYSYDLEGRVTHKGVRFKLSSNWVQFTGSVINNDMLYTEYNAFGQVSRRGINNKYIEKFDYDKAGRLWRTTSGDGTSKYFMYDKNGNQTLAIASDGNNIDNKTMAQVLALWGVSSSGTNANKIWTDYKDGLTATITKYDARNQAIEVREPERQIRNSARYDLITKRGYNAFGEMSYEIDANNARIDYTYNNLGRRIKVESPTVSITNINGSKVNVRPTEHYYYDHSGRLVAQRDANGNLTRQTLLKGSGYNGSQALVASVTSADNATITTKYDIHGDARKTTDQIGRVTNQYYDKMGRVTQINHAGGLSDYYQYDGLGQKIKHWNNQYYSGNAEQIDYDQQGRIVRQRAIGGDVTTYSYSWSSSYSTSGMGSFGGWNQNTTYANGKTLTERTDGFGRDIYSNDLSGRIVNSTFDKAGRVISRSGSGIEDQDYSYLNTNKLYQAWGQTGTVASQNWTRLTATYEYDKVGNLKKEALVQEGQYTYEIYDDYDDYGYPGGPPEIVVVNTNSTLKNATATYDALGRLKTWNESGNSITPVASRSFEYDANGNIRRSRAVFRSLDANGNASSSNSVDDYWYRFDNMNRVVTAKGKLSGGQIDRGTEGTDIFYNAAGERVYTLTSFEDSEWVQDGYEYGDYGFPEPVYIQVDFTNTRRENYTYDLAGRLTETKVSEGSYNENTGSVTQPSATGTRRGKFYYDKMGRQTRQLDYLSNGTTVAYDSTKVYNSKSQLTTETTIVRKGSNTYKTRSTYSYGSGSSYALGAATYISTTNYKKNSSYSVDYYSSTTNTYHWWNGAVQASTEYRPNTSQSKINRTYYYYSSGGYLQKASIIDGRSRTVTFTNDQNGQVIRRDERDNKYSSGDPHEIWYRFGGKEMGYVGNNGTNNTDYASSISTRTATQGTGAFQNGSNYGSSYADFDQAYNAINSFDQGNPAGMYTVRSGESLASIAANLWGDSSLWFKIAQANGLSGGASLIEGQSLVIPAGVSKSGHSASTFKPYDPGEINGDLNPTTPEPPKAGKSKKCGVLGAILLVVVAIAVTIVTAGAAVAALAPAGTSLGTGIATVLGTSAGLAGGVAGVAGTAGAVAIGAGAAAVGSIASQAVGVATGIQDKFSWKSVALAGISGGIGAGITEAVGVAEKFGGAVLRGAASNAISQGIGVATGLQDKFSWAGVAAAGVGAGVGFAVKTAAGNAGHGVANSLGLEAGTKAHGQVALGVAAALQGSASAIASAATRSAIDGTSFGQNIIAAIPNVVGQVFQSVVGACFTGDTQVHTPKGLRSIRDIKIGDWVFARNEHFRDETIHRRQVTQLFQFEEKLVLELVVGDSSGREEIIRTTPEHPFAVINAQQEDRSGAAQLSEQREIDGETIVKANVDYMPSSLGWVAASDLKLGDKVIDIHGRQSQVLGIEIAESRETVFNFTVDQDHTYFVSDMGIWVHNQYKPASDENPTEQEDNVTRQILAKALQDRDNVEYGNDPESSAAVAKALIENLLNAANDSNFLTNFVMRSANSIRIGELSRLYAVSASEFNGLDFLNDAQQERIQSFLGEGYNERLSSFRDNALMLETMPRLRDAAYNAYYGKGTSAHGTAGHINLVRNIVDNIGSGKTFQSTGDIGALNTLFKDLQRSGDVPGYHGVAAALFSNASSTQADEMSLSLNVAAFFNSAMLAGETFGAAYEGVGLLRASSFFRKSSTANRLSKLPVSLQQQKRLTELALESADELKDFATFRKALSPNELAAVQKHPWLAKAYFGTYVEARVANKIDNIRINNPDDVMAGVEWTGRGSSPHDFVGDGINLELTTNNPSTMTSHLNRPSVDALATYDALPSKFGYDFVEWLKKGN